MAAADPPHAEPAPMKRAEALDADRRVARARRVEPTHVPEQRRQRPPVDADQEQQDAAEHRGRSLPIESTGHRSPLRGRGGERRIAPRAARARTPETLASSAAAA